LDALRYYLVSRPKKKAVQEEKSVIQKDKERRARIASRRGRCEF
jgi:hypothetical protein